MVTKLYPWRETQPAAQQAEQNLYPWRTTEVTRAQPTPTQQPPTETGWQMPGMGLVSPEFGKIPGLETLADYKELRK